MPAPKIKEERLEARVTSKQKELLQRAAIIEGLSMSEYVVLKAQEAARRTVEDNERMVLSAEAAKELVETLLNPPGPNPRLVQAAKRYKKVMGL